MSMDSDIAELETMVQGHLGPGETVEVATIAQRNLRGGGLVRRGRRWGVVLTDRRLLLVETNPRTDRMVAIGEEHARGDVRVDGGPGGLLFKSLHVVDGAGATVAKLSFAVPNRPAAEALARALGGQPG